MIMELRSSVAHSSDYLTVPWYFHSDLQDIIKVKNSVGCELLLKLNVPYYLKIEILQESRMMIPDCQRRLEVAHAELSQLLENEKELEEAEEYKEARSILESVKLEA
ncbi:tubulin-specific chaperone A isoform X2 [Empidonax traillii]|uniref:tubulin-specific chaperone A isoform X2 n=1 Tax=Empidonax traillii TaxID=164674 RepID=UPI000FFDA2FE|nr:tubulin-specific chaperone A isoform X2 [Empidonax traillii]